MSKLEQSGAKLTPQRSLPATDRLALYNQYGSMAYGVILRVLGQPELAQKVLVDLFASPQLQSSENFSSNPAVTIIRLAREKALAARPSVNQDTPSLLKSLSGKTENVSELVFELSFCQGYTLQTVASQLQMAYTDTVLAVRNYFSYLRSR